VAAGTVDSPCNVKNCKWIDATQNRRDGNLQLIQAGFVVSLRGFGLRLVGSLVAFWQVAVMVACRSSSVKWTRPFTSILNRAWLLSESVND
jgi:hypothetical protein